MACSHLFFLIPVIKVSLLHVILLELLPCTWAGVLMVCGNNLMEYFYKMNCELDEFWYVSVFTENTSFLSSDNFLTTAVTFCISDLNLEWSIINIEYQIQAICCYL